MRGGCRSKEKNFEEDERFAPPLWDSRERSWRDGKGSFTEREPNRYGGDDDRWVSGVGGRGYASNATNRFEGRSSVDSRSYADADYVGFGQPTVDDSLLYPPFNGSRQPAPPPSTDDQVDREKAVAEAQESQKKWEEYLDEYAEKLSKVSGLQGRLCSFRVTGAHVVRMRAKYCLTQ